MTKAIFYDRRNKREVSSDELVLTKLVQSIAVGDSDDEYVPTGRRLNKEWTGEPFTKEQFDEAKAAGHFDNNRYEANITWESMEIETTPRVLYLVNELMADLCYKSEKCPDYINGDIYTMTNDLVFLRLE